MRAGERSGLGQGVEVQEGVRGAGSARRLPQAAPRNSGMSPLQLPLVPSQWGGGGAWGGGSELFVETIAKDAYVYAQQGKRKTLQRKDLDNAIEAIDEFAFLEGEFLVGLILF
uniref:Transcription factor CBF/NF-Y/archaeal histone domain-containing protein n=1 Tax=Chelonoidis abingdonii TaxID=106734 RepID=A0A8C0IJW8_CHEAB